MTRLLTDQEIAELLAERKPLPQNWQVRLRVREKANSAHKERQMDLASENENRFRIILRQSVHNPLDFSLILGFVDDDGNSYNLVRFNGRHPSQHTNRWEKARGKPNASFRNRFHMHKATERYQVEGLPIDGYAG
jgi:hypothetical protein